MTVTPVSPSKEIHSDPPLRTRRTTDGDEDLFGSESDASLEPAEAEEENEVVVDEDDGVEGFIVREDEDVKPKNDPRALEPLLCGPCDSRIPVTLNNPIRPSAEDVEKHYTTHYPYRSWCSICVDSKGKEDAHRAGANNLEDGDKHGIPIFSLDYNDVQTEAVKTIVGKDETSGMVTNHKVICKGAEDEYIAKKIVKDLEDMGRRDVILKTDGEPAMVKLQSKIIAMRAGRTVPRYPPAYNPQSNGPCEKAVQDAT